MVGHLNGRLNGVICLLIRSGSVYSVRRIKDTLYESRTCEMTVTVFHCVTMVHLSQSCLSFMDD